MSTITDNLASIHERIALAAERSGRSSAEVQLLAVSKTFPVEIIAEAVAAGHTVFGENRVQELQVKVPALPSKLSWHLIGHLQSNKVRKALPLVDAIHSVGSLDLAQDVNRIAAELGLRPKIYLEVNLAVESNKHGFTAEQLREQLEALCALPRLEIQGLMCIPPFDPDAEKTRPYFQRLRQLRDELEKQGSISLPALSMGMSHDFAVAVEEGSTIIRVGSAIFGGR